MVWRNHLFRRDVFLIQTILLSNFQREYMEREEQYQLNQLKQLKNFHLILINYHWQISEELENNRIVEEERCALLENSEGDDDSSDDNSISSDDENN